MIYDQFDNDFILYAVKTQRLARVWKMKTRPSKIWEMEKQNSRNSHRQDTKLIQTIQVYQTINARVALRLTQKVTYHQTLVYHEKLRNLPRRRKLQKL